MIIMPNVQVGNKQIKCECCGQTQIEHVYSSTTKTESGLVPICLVCEMTHKSDPRWADKFEV